MSTDLPHVDTVNIDDELKDRILEALLEVEDPELNVDIVDLGLVYELELGDEGALTVTMTLTSMGCPLAGTISNMVTEAVSDIPEVKEANVNIVWSPPWSAERMSKLARYALGFHRS